MGKSVETDVAVIGGGPGGYVAAFHAADLGLRSVIVETRERPGGVCLYEGCIPSKALLHAAEILTEAQHASHFGLEFSKPKIHLERLRKWKDEVVDRLTGGVSQLSGLRGVDLIQGRARFTDSGALALEAGEIEQVRFKHAIIATGSRPSGLPGIEIKNSRVLDSTTALQLESVPKTLLVAGGGYIGLELGQVYAALGSRVTVVELLDGLLPGADRDLVRPLEKRLEGQFEAVYVKTRVVGMKENKKGIQVRFEGKIEEKEIVFEKVLISVGRKPNSEDLGLGEVGVEVDSHGFILVDEQRRTHNAKIFAIGDVAGQPMLAHKAMRDGKVAAEAIAGRPTVFDNLAIPAVVFTDPEVAWCGLTETEAAAEGRDIKVTKFPWPALGRAITLGRTDGLTKMMFDPESGRILGVGVVGRGAGEMIAEGALAIEMGAVAEDVAATIHTHPTLSESMGEVAEAFLGHSTHVFRKKK